MTCEMCGKRMKAHERRYNQNGEIYRHYVCAKCGWDNYTVEYEVEQTDGFIAAWKAAGITAPRRRKENAV